MVRIISSANSESAIPPSRSWPGSLVGQRRSLGGRLCGRRGVGGGLLSGWEEEFGGAGDVDDVFD
jgi:hypothetical protein